jgi:hypothetical protein
MPPLVDKLIHFVVGLFVGTGFWWVMERYFPSGVREELPAFNQNIVGKIEVIA